MFFLLPVIFLLCSCAKEENGIVKSLNASLAGTRYIDEIFSTVDSSFFNTTYRIASTFHATDTTLKMDVYQPSGDTVSLRPVVVVIHGGAFYSGSEKDPYARTICNSLAKRGYVAISIGYRLGIGWTPLMSVLDSMQRQQEAFYKASQDARAAIRFIKKNSGIGKLDTTRMFVAGVSAGALTAINVAYLDPNELPASFVSLNGPLDGTGIYDYPGYSVKTKGVINMEGAILDTGWIKRGDIPLLSYYGTSDQYYSISGTDSTSPHHSFYGGQGIKLRVDHLGISNGMVTYPGGHGTVCSSENINATINSMSGAMKAQL